MDVIVDGYNLIFSIKELGSSTEKSDIEFMRNRFLSILEQYKEERKHKLIVVFDGKGSVVSSETRVAGIEVVFSRPDLDADEEIKRMVSNSKRPRQIIVVTSDRNIIQFVRKYGSKVVEPLKFYKDVKKKITRLSTSKQEGRKIAKEEEKEPISKYIGPTKAEAQYWLKVFSNKQENG
ncbi:MAG: hypothetical protein SCARUB_03995 [Candidatus Scalindua rubra]|uniref:YacP-like NYN domain protein n=1 Tax=Candidatus Scalindua rubra TaxID=1872076 RepID=A0A1E3X5J8_9BACT|nr:MAG: hypothetical protein SCARUB_03995 [Candidatus Scalindua rubra]